jgi:hypothetical protein
VQPQPHRGADLRQRRQPGGTGDLKIARKSHQAAPVGGARIGSEGALKPPNSTAELFPTAWAALLLSSGREELSARTCTGVGGTRASSGSGRAYRGRRRRRRCTRPALW